MSPSLSRTLNILGLLAVGAVLLIGFAAQLLNGELPCPLCLLQRSAFAAVMVGLALNVRFGPRPSHYGIVILSALVGAAISTRQTLLHIVPGTGTFGDAILGLHFYTWALVLFMAIVLGSAAMLLFDRQFAPIPAGAKMGLLGVVALVLAFAMSFGNGVSTVLECAGGLCPDNPEGYILLQGASPSDATPPPAAATAPAPGGG
ncbi:Disulfide bond formation protein DsbB [Pseudoxanthobacter soli DSM 19599]|uniref:Disulfide bond formation protein DsbB n=1 Tax=Pseudoxanthobacter soli DSM 19599 TaxID=1123029 RepID=A0A1M7ZFG6_9HYPH|nr:disulfide bond formation protein B [Pseudoxanthobacter soli]SHO63618.1 Disulfide bond formation protein DsbB [Pseudoxanthobacter soli DSM 19599]